MAVDNDKIKDLFSSKLGNFEPEVPASVWGGLDQLLSDQPAPSADVDSSSTSNSSSSSATSGAGNASIIKTIVITVGVAAAITAGILLIPRGEDADKEKNKEELFVDRPQIQQEEQIADTAQLIPDMPIVIKGIPRTYTAKVEEKAIEAKPEIVDALPSMPKEEETQPEEQEKKEEKAEEALIAEEEMAPPIKILKGGFSVGVNASVNLFTENINQRGGDILFSQAERGSAFMDILKEENSNYKLKHSQPISFGVTVGKQIFPRLSLETGLVYTYLHSEISSDSKFQINESQDFHYLGIPLSLNYTFYEVGKTRLYVSLGGMVQKDIKGRYKSNMNFLLEDIPELEGGSNMFYTEPYYIKKSIKQDNPQFSVYSSLGVSYPLYKKMYLYGTIGGAYYFDAGNRYSTIYLDRKFQLNLNMGLKFDF